MSIGTINKVAPPSARGRILVYNRFISTRPMKVPNWQHHSRKEQKRKLKPQALRQAKARLKAFKKKHSEHSERSVFFFYK